jgi:hypothetical protein
MPSDTVERRYFTSVCEERDRLRDLLRLEQRRHAWLQDRVEQHRQQTKEPKPADRQLWSAIYATGDRP